MDNLVKISSLKVNNMFIIANAGNFPSCESFLLSCSSVCVSVCGSFLNCEVTQYDASYTQVLI